MQNGDNGALVYVRLMEIWIKVKSTVFVKSFSQLLFLKAYCLLIDNFCARRVRRSDRIKSFKL